MATQAVVVRRKEEDERTLVNVFAPADWGALIAHNNIVVDSTAPIKPLTITAAAGFGRTFVLGHVSNSYSPETHNLTRFFFENVVYRALTAPLQQTALGDAFEYNSVSLRNVRTVNARVTHIGKIRPLPFSDD